MNAPAKAAPGATAPSFAGVGYEEALAGARSLVPQLRERAERAEEARILLPAERLAIFVLQRREMKHIVTNSLVHPRQRIDRGH